MISEPGAAANPLWNAGRPLKDSSAILMIDWIHDLSESDKPRYIAIADAIAKAVRRGRISAADRLPPQRELALKLKVDFTTVARGYAEAQRRGLVEGRVGQGTFVVGTPSGRNAAPLVQAGRDRRARNVDLSMNLPPEPSDPDLLARMGEGLAALGTDLVGLLRYQDFGGNELDKEAVSVWLGRQGLVPKQERTFVVPGAHAALLGILGLLAERGDVILAEELTYPGTRSICAQLGLRLVGLPMDEEGVRADAFAEACRRHAPKALYVNPTMLNPTTHTVSAARRAEIVDVARRFGVAIVEDDPYGLLAADSPEPFACIAPDMAWHVAGLSKILGAGLRIAYVIAPDTRSGWSFAAAVRTATVMASPLTAALATRWILDGTADALLAAVRNESAARQAIAATTLPAGSFRAHPAGFHLWLSLPKPWTLSAFVGHTRATGIGIVASDAFAVGSSPPQAVRVCLGGSVDRSTVQMALEFMAHALTETPDRASISL